MHHPPIHLLLEDDLPKSGWLQHLGGGDLWSTQPVVPGAIPAARPEALESLETSSDSPGGEWTVIYDGPALVDGGMRTIRSSLSSDGQRRVDFEDGESFFVDPLGGVLRRKGAGEAGALSLERALGAPLALALALHGIHLLHASAVVRGPIDGATGLEGAMAFTAPSGGGKSTLAAAFERHERTEIDFARVPRIVRIADDQLPVRLGPRPLALPHFPQLKLARGEGYPEAAPLALPLDQLFEIEHSPTFRAIEIERLSATDACLALARATVAAKLFDPALLEAHFALCAAAGAHLPVHRLRYPSGRDRLPEVFAALGALPNIRI